MLCVSVRAGDRSKLHLVAEATAGGGYYKALKEQLVLAFETDSLTLTSKLGDLDVAVTSNEELLVISAYHEATGLPLDCTVRPTEDQKQDLKFPGSPEAGLVWVGNLPTDTDAATLSTAVTTATGLTATVTLLEKAAGQSSSFALLLFPSAADHALVDKLSGIAFGDRHVHAVLADVEHKHLGVELTPQHKHKKGKKAARKASNAKRASVTTAPLLLKHWKAEFLKRELKADLAKISAELEVQFTWATPTSLNITGKGNAIKDARKRVETLLEKVQAFGQLSIPSPDLSFKVRVINQCRILEKEINVVLLVDNSVTPKVESKEDNNVKVLVVGTEKSQFDIVRTRLTQIPKQMFEIRCAISRKDVEEFKKIKQSNPEKVDAIKSKNKVYSIKVLRGKVVLRGTVKENLEKAEKEIKALLPLSVPSGGGLRISTDLRSSYDDSFVSPVSPRNDLESSSSHLHIDVEQLRQLNQSALHVETLHSPSSDSSAPTSPNLLSPDATHHDEKTHLHEVEEDAIPSENLESTKSAEEVFEEQTNDPDLPDFWDYMPKGVNCLAALVEPDSEEWKMVQNSLDFTPTIKSIERIQNKALYREFQAVKKDLESQSKPSDSQFLWCGTMAAVPEEVYDSLNGFKTKFDGQGVFQFWKKASYSNVFAYSLKDGSKQLFLAETITGGRSRMSVKDVPAYPTYLVTLR